MSCQSLAARAFADTDKEIALTNSFHRSVRFSSESRSSPRVSRHDSDKRDTPGSISLLALSVTSQSHPAMSQSAPSPNTFLDDDTPPPTAAACRFPKLEDCAHFHYERVSLGGVSIETSPCEDQCATHNGAELCAGWICLKVRSHVTTADTSRQLNASWTEASDVTEWTLTRNKHNFLHLDDMLHRCIYDRKVSGLPDLSQEITEALVQDKVAYARLISDYVHHLSIIADDSINCGPVLNWLQMDNKGHKLLVANEDSSSINTPAVAAAYSVRKYVSQARDEISFEVGDMISIIDMPGPQESLWWRGKRGFRVGFFPHNCVAVIGDKVPRHMTQPPPCIGSVAVAPIKPVLRKHGKLISLFRSFILSRPSRRSLKQQGILRERVFGCDLGEHLLNCGQEVPLVLIECARVIEERGAVDGIYRLSGGSGLIQRLRAAFDEGKTPDLTSPPVVRDPHALASLLKMYFRELPNPLCTYQLYSQFVDAVQTGLPESAKLANMRAAVVKLPPPHYRTLGYLMRHLKRVSLLGACTGMTGRNMAIVWAPNLLRAPHHSHALHHIAQQAVVTEFLICYAEELFSEEQGETVEEVVTREEVENRARRPKSLPIGGPTKLLSLEEARRRGKTSVPATISPRLPPPSGAIAAAATTQLKPSGSLKPKYIEVGSGPNNLPQYHTVLDLPAPGSKRGVKRSESGWRALFSRSKQQRAPPSLPPPSEPMDIPLPAVGLRPVKSCESLQSESDTVGPLAERGGNALKQHTRSASCDSYFEPWQAELADMRLRLSPQERDNNMFSEEDDTMLQLFNQQGSSVCSSPSEQCSVEPSPRRLLVDIHAHDIAERKRSAMEEELASIGYIDGDSPRTKPSDLRNADRAAAKRICKDRDSPKTSSADVQSSVVSVKLRERNSPRKVKNSVRYSGYHQSPNLSDVAPRDRPICQSSRLTWHGKDGHSTLIKIDWPIENTSISNLTSSTLNSAPITPLTPCYDQLESDSDVSDNKHTIKITENKNCDNCLTEKCLKCELKATDYGNVKTDFKIGQPVTPKSSTDNLNLHDSLEPSPVPSTAVSYQNLNRLSAISTSSNSDHHSDKKREYDLVTDRKSIMTSSHESSSSYSNASKHDELYECYSFTRPNYINLHSSSTSKSSPTSPLKSPLKSTISITFRSPTKNKTPDYELIENVDTPTNERDSVYEDVDLEKNLSIVEEATIPDADACLPTQQACQPDSFDDLIILETPTEELKFEDDNVYNQVKFLRKTPTEELNVEDADVYNQVKFLRKTPTEELNVEDADVYNQVKFLRKTPTEELNVEDADVYNQVKFLRKSIEEVNAMVLESPEKEIPRHYENVSFSGDEIQINDYENINVDALRICDKDAVKSFNDLEFNKDINTEVINTEVTIENDNGNTVKEKIQKNLNVRELANRFESPTEQKGPFTFEKFKAEIKYPSLERKEEEKVEKRSQEKTVSPKSFRLSKNATNARSLDENAFTQEFAEELDKRKSLEVNETKKTDKFQPDLNLNLEETKIELSQSVTPTTENKISLVQRFDKPDIRNLIGFDTEKKLSRERIEKYKEERRNFLREKYSSQSFRSNPDNLTRLKLKKETEEECERLKEELPKFERRNTVDLGQRMRFSLAKSANNLHSIPSPEKNIVFNESDFDASRQSRDFDRTEKISPSYTIRNMAAMFEQKSQNNGTG